MNANDNAVLLDVPVPGSAGQRLDHRRPSARSTAAAPRRVARSGRFRHLGSAGTRHSTGVTRSTRHLPKEGTSHATAAPARAARHRRPRPRGRRHPRRHRAARRHWPGRRLGDAADRARPPAGPRRPLDPAAARRRLDRTTWSAPCRPGCGHTPSDHRAWSDPRAGLRRAGPDHRRPHLLRQGRPGPGPGRRARPRRLGAAHRARPPWPRPGTTSPRRCTRPTPRCGSTRTAPPAEAIRSDALTELGRYPEALRAAHRADDLDPGPSTFARLSYQAELRGDLAGATRLMRLSQQAAGTSASSYAFATFHLGELARAAGKPGAAAHHYRNALDADPTYLPALAGQARLAVARGDLRRRRARLPARRAAAPPHRVRRGARRAVRGDRPSGAGRGSSTPSPPRRRSCSRPTGSPPTSRPRCSRPTTASPAEALTAARAEWDRAALDPHRRRPRLGAARRGPRPGGAALRAARQPARHPGRAAALPPRRDRGGPAGCRRRRAHLRRRAAARRRRQPVARGRDQRAAGRCPMSRLRGARRSPSSAARCALLVGLPAAASAHPLGNFTVNRYSGVVVSPRRR